MDPPALLDELLRTCITLGLVVRNTPMKVPATRLAGGLVRLRGNALVIVDSSAPVVDRIAAVADALCELAVDPLHLSSEARRALMLARARRRRLRRQLRLRKGAPILAWKTTLRLRQQREVEPTPVSHEPE